jgi:HSP20 family protein
MLGEMMPREMPTASRRFDPVGQMQRAQADLNRLFGGLRFSSTTEFPLLNLWTSPDGAIVAAEVPGIVPEDLDITIRRDTVIVRGIRPPEPVDQGTLVQRQERTHGPFARTILLPFRVDADKASARFERGVVTLTLPRPEDDKPRQIKVARS